MQQEYRLQEPTFAEIEPKFTPKGQNLTDITIACCNNVIKVAPNSENSNIIQSCNQKINRDIENLQFEKAVGKPVIELPTIANINKEQSKNLLGPNNAYLWIGSAIVLLIIIITIIIIVAKVKK